MGATSTFAGRRAAAREAARRRIAATIDRPIAPERRSVDPLERSGSRSGTGAAAAALVAACVIHAGVLAAGTVFAGGGESERERRPVIIEMREREPVKQAI